MKFLSKALVGAGMVLLAAATSQAQQADEMEEAAVVLTADEQREFEILKRVYVLAIEKMLNQETLDEAQQGIGDLEVGGQKGHQVGERFDPNRVTGGDDVFKGVSSQVAKQLGVSEGDSSNFLGQLLGITKPDLKNPSAATKEDLADAMAKAVFSVSVIKDSQKLSGAADGRGDSMGGGGNGGDSGRAKARAGIGHDYDDDGDGGFSQPIIEYENTDKTKVQNVAGTLATAATFVRLIGIGPLAFLAMAVLAEVAFDSTPVMRLDNPNPMSDNLGALDRVAQRLEWVKKVGAGTSAGSTTGTVYPKGSPGGILPRAVSGKASSDVEGGSNLEIDDSVVDPRGQKSRVPHLKYKSDEPVDAGSARQ